VIRELEQPRVAADLAQLEQGFEEDHAGAFEAAGGDCGADPFVHGGADGFVEVLLAGVQLDRVDEFDLGRQFGGHLILGAAEDERGEAGFEGVAAGFVVVLLDRDAEAFAEVLAAEEAGHQEAHQAPQFAEVVFDRGAREAEPVAGIELAGGRGDLGARVLDVLGLVEDGDVVRKRSRSSMSRWSRA
jgi:hypothetical protein